MAKKLISLIIAFALVSGSLGAFAYEDFGKNAYRIYVSPAGSDSAAGSIDAPLNTLQEAQKRVRNILANADGKNKGVMVYLRGGDYPVSEGIKLTREDSGTEKAPVIYRSYPGEKAVLVGGAALNAAHFKPASNNAVVSRITDKTARESVLCINLEEEGFGDIGELYMDGSYTYSSPFPQGPDTNNVELFINGNIMNNARYPNDGYMIISEVLKDSYQVSGMPGAKTDGGDIFGGIEITSEDKRYLQWKNSDCGVLCGYWYYDWADQSLPIKDIDMEKGSISTKLSSRYGTKKGQRFFAYNLPEEIDIPGEYYIDRATKVLYIYPPEGFGANSSARLSYTKDDIFTVDGAENIQIKDIDFTAMRKSAVRINSGKNITVNGCTISYSADYAVYTMKDARSCTVKNCYIHDVNGGVYLDGGVDETLTEGNNIVENCEIERFSRLTKTYKGAVILQGVGNKVYHNEIHDAPHLAIMFGGFDNIIEGNEIYDVVKSTDDASAIYGGQTWLCRGLVIKNNYIHDITTESSQNVGVSAVYIDGAQCDVTMEGNIVENISGDAFKINGGRDNIYNNNIAINCKAGVDLCYVPEGEFSYQRRIDSIEKSSIWSHPEERPWEKEPFKSRYPEMLAMLDDEPMLPKNNSMKNNVFVNTEEIKLTQISENIMQVEGSFVTNKDPGFADMSRRNYALKPNSEVYSQIPGFVPLSFNMMGRYDKAAIYKTKDAVALSIGSPYAATDLEKTLIDKENMNVTPVIVNNITFVPIRFIAETLGAEVSYDNGKITVNKDNTAMEMNIGSTNALINGSTVALGAAPYISENRAMLPLRSVCEMFNKTVFWDNCGLIVISNEKVLDGQNDGKIINYLCEYLGIY